MSKEYIGDGLYAEFDGYGVTVTSEDGISVLDRVYFEPEVLDGLNNYVARRRAIIENTPPASASAQEGGTL